MAKKRKSRIYAGATVVVDGVKFKISSSDAKGKKWKATGKVCKTVNGIKQCKTKTVNFGAKGFNTGSGTKRGNNYCTRSLGIKTTKKFAPNTFSRIAWNCEGKKSKRK